MPPGPRRGTAARACPHVAHRARYRSLAVAPGRDSRRVTVPISLLAGGRCSEYRLDERHDVEPPTRATSNARRLAMTAPTVLVTGASAGFGVAIARRFVGGGAQVVACGRRADRLASLASELGERVHAIELDVRDHAAVE